jgi:DNA invertase Pin-like site-specific DNA recombinase
VTKPTSPLDVYIRVSRVGGRENLISPEEQEHLARAHAKQLGLRVGKVLPPDLDESGGKWDRPGLQEAIRRVRDGRSGGIVAADVDRFSRDSEHGLRLLRELEEAGARFYAPNAPDDMTTPEGEFQIGLWFLLAQLERKRKRAGFERAKEQAIARGIPVTNRPAVGYRQREDRRLEPDPEAAPIIRELFERRACGDGPSALADFLQGRGIKTSQGSAFWSKPAIAHVISSRVYLGELAYGGDRRFVNASAHEPIVDLATWQAAQQPNGSRLRQPRRGDYLLTGLLRCQACGYVMQGTRTSRGKRMYRCMRRHAGGTCPHPTWIFADVIEPVAERAFWTITDDVQGTVQDASDDLSGLETALDRAERRLTQAMAPEVQDAAGEAWTEMIRARRSERDKAAKDLGAARAAQRGVEGLPSVKTLRALWDGMSASDKRELIATKVDLFTLDRSNDDGAVALVVFPAGTRPAGLSRRGFRREPRLHPLDIPAGARVVALKECGERASKSTV